MQLRGLRKLNRLAGMNINVIKYWIVASSIFALVVMARAFQISHVGATKTIVGTDLSLLNYYERQGTIYQSNSEPVNVLQMLKGMGINCIRLRLFTSSAAQAQADPYDYINNLTYTVPLAQQVKTNGLQFLLDLHYSDTWAGRGKQVTPSTWTNLTFTQLLLEVRDYSSNTIAAFKSAGAMPDFVQVGNEIDGGILWPYGEVDGNHDTPAQWAQLGKLLDAGIQGIKDACGTNMPKIVIHIAQGQNWGFTKSFFDKLVRQQVPFDIIGETYYPVYDEPLCDLSNCFSNTVQRYDRPAWIVETAFPWGSRTSTNVIGFPVSFSGQVAYVHALARTIKALPTGSGSGIFWWGAECPGDKDWSWFDEDANLLPVASAFGKQSWR